MLLFSKHKIQKLVNNQFIAVDKSELAPGDVFQVCYSDGGIVISRQVVSDGIIYDKVTSWLVENLSADGSFTATPHEAESFRHKDKFEVSAEPRPTAVIFPPKPKDDLYLGITILGSALLAITLLQFSGAVLPALGSVSAAASIYLSVSYFRGK